MTNPEDTAPACKWCAQGNVPKVLDSDGTLVSITGNAGTLSHAHEEYWWPCLRFGVELRAPATSPRCPKCNYVMCQQFDYQPVNGLAEIATPNGQYVCYYCSDTPPKAAPATSPALQSTPTGHILLTPQTCPCDKLSDQSCNVCDGGLAICSKCGKAESELNQSCVQSAPTIEPDACWHCGDVLVPAPKPRCEDCPDECDEPDCDEMGCTVPAAGDKKDVE